MVAVASQEEKKKGNPQEENEKKTTIESHFDLVASLDAYSHMHGIRAFAHFCPFSFVFSVN
jgi:hypothetical protein